MTQCERLQELLSEALVAGNQPLIDALNAALEAAGCTVQTDSGGTGRPGNGGGT